MSDQPAQPGNSGPCAVHPAALLRQYGSGVLVLGDETRWIKFVVDGRDGSLVFPCDKAALEAESVVLMVPDLRDDALHLLLTVTELADWRIDDACDRWQAYCGRPDGSTWVRGRVESARFEGRMVDENQLTSPNPLMSDEPRLINALNKDRESLIAAVTRMLKRPCPDARVVGIDGWGIDVRVMSGVVIRVQFTLMATTVEGAMQQVQTMYAMIPDRAGASEEAA